MPKKVLITDGNYRNALAAHRSLPSGFQIDVTSECIPLNTLCRLSKYSNSIVRVNSINDRFAYGKQLIEILQSGSYDYYLPVGLNSYLASSIYKNEILKVTHCLLPNWEDMKIAYNKDRTTLLANQIGVPTPRTIILTDIKDIDKIDFSPIVVKTSDQSSVHYCNGIEEVSKIYKKLSNLSKSNVIAQEYVTGYGCGFYAVYREGQLMDFFLHKRLREFPITGGASAVAESYRSKRLFELGKLLGDALKWNGPIMVEFKYDYKVNDYKLIEVNPKLWGSLDLTLAAGVNIPQLIFGISDGSIVEPIASKFEDAHYIDVRFRWPFPDQFKIFCAQPSLHSMKEIFYCNAITNNTLTDPLPSLFMVWTGLKEGLIILINEERRYPHGRKPSF